MADSDEDEEYEIERILAEDEIDGRRYYLVKWLGYDDEHCTWEPIGQFTSLDSIKVWERQKAEGKGLDDEWVAMIQERIDAHQKKLAQIQESNGQLDGSNEDQHSVDSSSPEAPPAKKKRQNDTTKLTRKVVPTTSAAPEKRIERSVDTLGIKPRQASQLGRPFGSLTKKKDPSLDKAGQRFRNLSHMNNYRKKSRTEPEPNLAPEQLKSVSAFDIGKETAHILPLDRESHLQTKDEASLFIPDTSTHDLRGGFSPIAEISAFPPAMTDYMNDSGARNPGSSNRSTSSSIPGPPVPSPSMSGPIARIGKQINDAASSVLPARQSSDTSLPNHVKRRAVDDLPKEFPLAPLPPQESVFRAQNGRSWYRGDIMCNFSMGRPIGYATIIHVPYFPHGIKIVKLKRDDESELNLDFDAESFSKQNFIETFQNSYDQPLALGLINPFPDTQHNFDQFAEYLESNDIAAVFNSIVLGFDISLLLYSIFAESWTYLGWKPARAGKPRLHIAILPKLRSNVDRQEPTSDRQPKLLPVRQDNKNNNNNMTHVTQPLSMQKAYTTHPDQQTRPRSPSLPPDVRQVKLLPASANPSESLPGSPTTGWTIAEVTPGTMVSESPASESTTRDPRLRRKSGMDTTAPTRPSEYYPRLDYEVITTSYPRNPNRSNRIKLDPKNARFFISFAQSHHHEAKTIQVWLETKTKPSDIYLDSERHDWTRFKEKKEDGISVVLFHEDALNYPKLPGLYQLLFLEIPTAFAIKFSSDAGKKLDISSARIRQLFPRATLYLVTETMIIENAGEALAVLDYFSRSKKPGYKIMMRPNVEQWLLEALPAIQDEPRRGNLINILCRIRDLKPTSDSPVGLSDDQGDRALIGVKEDLQESNYIIMPSNLPVYDEVASHAPPAQTTSHNLVADLRKRRDGVLKEYFNGYSAMQAANTRRFIVFYSSDDAKHHEAMIKQKQKDNKLDCGHVFYYELERFVEKHCQRF